MINMSQKTFEEKPWSICSVILLDSYILKGIFNQMVTYGYYDNLEILMTQYLPRFTEYVVMI